jgi:hypothetical protein
VQADFEGKVMSATREGAKTVPATAATEAHGIPTLFTPVQSGRRYPGSAMPEA